MSSVSSAVSFIYPSNTMPRTQLSKVQALVRGRKVRRDALRLAAATTKIQALIRGRKFRRPRTAAATKLQTRARSQQARRTVSDLRTKRIVARSAYKSYLNAWSLDNKASLDGRGWSCSTLPPYPALIHLSISTTGSGWKFNRVIALPPHSTDSAATDGPSQQGATEVGAAL